MAKTLLHAQQQAINALKEKLRAMDGERYPGKFARLSATLRRLERQVEKHPKATESEPVPEEQTISGLTGTQWRYVFETENARRTGEAKANFSQEGWLDAFA